MQLVIKSLNFNFQVESRESLKNGDIKYFGFLTTDIVKTYCYISESQIQELKENHKLSWVKHTSKNLRSNLWTKNNVLEQNLYINLGLLFLKKWQFSIFKKYPFLQFLLNDQPEIFHKVKNKNYSYKEISNFRFDDFSFNYKRSQEGVCFRLKDVKNSNELCKEIFGNNFPKISKKILMNHIFEKRGSSIHVNYELIRKVDFLKKLFTAEEIVKILENKFDSLDQIPLFKDICYRGLHLEHNYFGVVKYLSSFKDSKKRFQELKRFNVPYHVLSYFTTVMKKPFDYFKPDVLKASDALYLYNSISRDYGRIHIKNFELESMTNPFFLEIIKAIDGLIVKDFTFTIPKDYHTLVDWGSALCNCAGNFETIEEYSNKLFIGIKKDNKIVYLLDYTESQNIKQFKGYKNSKPSSKEFDLLITPIVPFLKYPERCLKDLKKNGEESSSLF